MSISVGVFRKMSILDVDICRNMPICVEKCRYLRRFWSIFVDICRYMSKNVDFCVDPCRYMSKNVDFCVDFGRCMSKNVDFCVDLGRYLSISVDIFSTLGLISSPKWYPCMLSFAGQAEWNCHFPYIIADIVHSIAYHTRDGFHPYPPLSTIFWIYLKFGHVTPR